MANLAKYEAAGAQVVGVSVESPAVLEEFSRKNSINHLLLSDAGRKMLPAYGALVTDKASPIYRYAKRAYFVVDRRGILRWKKIQDNPLDLLKTEEILEALRKHGS